ncbi:MAG: DUF104 domain-containing protein [Chloroflexi bacterium]|nr:DUF104 domain-containing protein [Chloroflexota bacterium]
MKTITAEAIFQDGVIKVLTEVPLEENERIKLQIERAPHRAQRSSRNLLHLRGIWKEHLRTHEKDEDWVSTTLAEIRRESSERIVRTASEIEKVLQNA